MPSYSSTAAPPAAPRPKFLTGLGWTIVLHVVVFLSLAAWSWRKWPDPLIDFGRELYVPWQITRGMVLYRDLASLFGPLSPYVNAGLFRTFGVSMTTLIVANLVIFALMLAGIHYLVRRSCGSVVASVVTIIVMLLFGFSGYTLVGNYNFVCPYSHEATHGMALAVAMLVAFQRGADGRKIRWMGLAGLCFGLVLLTKPEVAIAAVVAIVVGFVALAAAGAEQRWMVPRALASFMTAAVLPPLFFFAYFATRLPAGDALRATAGAWAPLWTANLAGNLFYGRVTGLDHPLTNVARMFLAFGECLAFVVAATFAARGITTHAGTRAARIARTAVWFVLFGVAVLTPWPAIPRALPLTTVAILAWVAAPFVRRRGEAAMARLPLLTWGAFGLGLLSKIALNAHLSHYGFYLSLPATTLLVIALIKLLPDWLAARYSTETAELFRRMTRWIIAAGIVPYLVASNVVYRTKVVPVGTGGDLLYASNYRALWQGPATRDALAAILELSGPAEPVAVLPEGVMLNYLARRTSPLRVINLMPPEWLVFGENDALASLQKHPPKLIVLVEKDVSEYGYPPFGTDPRYGRTTMDWIRDHYETRRGIARDPETGAFHVTVLARKIPPPTNARR